MTNSKDPQNTKPKDSGATFPLSLTRKCLQLFSKKQRFSNESVELSAELLRLFVLEARRRAAIEAECELEAEEGHGNENVSMDASTSDSVMEESEQTSKKKVIIIRDDHIAKISAELLMDLS